MRSSEKGQYAPLTVLRSAVDWTKLLYDHPPPWANLQANGWPELASVTLGDKVLGLVRQGTDPERDEKVSYQGEGLRVFMRRPDKASRETGQYPVEVDVQGLACSTTLDGLEAVDGLRAGVESWLWPDEDVSHACLMGKIDICNDVAVHLPRFEGSAWIERELFSNGNIDDATGRFSTRASQRTRQLAGTKGKERKNDKRAREARLMGSAEYGRTLYLGRDPQVVLYEKDLDPNKDVPLVRDRWKEANWNGLDRVFRVETSVTRTWLADNDVRMKGGKARRLAGPPEPVDAAHAAGGAMRWSEARKWIPAVARAVLERTRMRTTGGRGRTRQREDAALWPVLFASLDEWEERLARQEGHPNVAMWRGVGTIVSRAREYSRDRATKRVERGLAELLAHVAADKPTVGLEEVAQSVAWSIEQGFSRYTAEALDKYARRVAWKLGLPPPPPVRGAEANRAGALPEDEPAALAHCAVPEMRAVTELRALVNRMTEGADLEHVETRALYEELRELLARLEGGDG